MDNKIKKPRALRHGISISPISGLEVYICRADPSDEDSIKCVIWNLSNNGICLLLNGVFQNLKAGHRFKLKCSAAYEQKDFSWDCEIIWVSTEVFVTFLGASFSDIDHERDNFFQAFRRHD